MASRRRVPAASCAARRLTIRGQGAHEPDSDGQETEKPSASSSLLEWHGSLRAGGSQRVKDGFAVAKRCAPLARILDALGALRPTLACAIQAPSLCSKQNAYWGVGRPMVATAQAYGMRLVLADMLISLDNSTGEGLEVAAGPAKSSTPTSVWPEPGPRLLSCHHPDFRSARPPDP
jgi:hypothetical protein